MNTDAHVAIIGGSLVGPAAELLFRRAGFHNVTTYEALPHPHSQSGGVMGLRTSTLSMLATIGVEPDSVKALATSDVYAFDMNHEDISLRGKSTFPGDVTSWDALHHALVDRTDVHHGRKVIGIRDDGNGFVLTFKGGREIRPDLTIFADGRKSFGREALDPDRPMSYSGYIVWRGLTQPPSMKIEGFHRHYDIPDGVLFSLTEPVLQSGMSYWEFSHNFTEDAYTAMAGKPPTERAFLMPHQTNNGRVREVLQDHADVLPERFRRIVLDSDVSVIPVNDVPMPRRAVWYSGQSAAVLLGDALIPVRLQVGAGLNQGLHQAYELVDQLSLAGFDALPGWETMILERLAPYVELGRSRAHRNNLGNYSPVRPGFTAAPVGDQWTDPRWVSA